MTSDDRLVVVVGPTASGKSALAVHLCHELGGEVVNADSMQLYRGMDIGTAKASSQEREGVPHHLIDVLDPAEPASVAAYQQQARAVVADCSARGVVPVVVGGSSLYVRAVLDRLDFPGTDPQVRARWTRQLQQDGPQALHAELRRVAPQAAESILPSNGRRIVRALEVTEITGEPFVATMPPHESIYADVTMIGLDVDREVLDQRIRSRVEQMWADGLVQEVRALRDLGLAETPTAGRALGYSQALAQLAGELSEEEAKAATARATSAFARRQDRLFRKDSRITWLPHDSPTLTADALRCVR
ncbi:tRNA (adenosine(37)-N6)-dimethylallyltransferase MiaA [Aeromicrobium sp. CTD01-1L150]|uniref:tRNA (adenosine(37)-N6)-dimethylallyltransferase MiaA n=1 Tax=Aeromicrobium sp. CTD01-1L150 TaxID=3341830 RepID=UPI0035C25330